MKNLKLLLIEITWLLGCAIVSYFLVLIILGNSGLDINLHDTYFAFQDKYYLICLAFLFTSFPIYFIKENRHSFHRKLPFATFLTLGLGLSSLIIKASPFFLFLPVMNKNEWKVYPPLSIQNTPSDILPKDTPLPTFLTPINFLILFQIIVIALMLFAAYKYGKRKN
ncbi:hypothetical protein [Pedobacter sp. UBA5917]|jgi:hypothetical protein|uniref:hypothetical protein n=1 Tax=Pedobacter sp. UBA5917 TaxID=1947061 RepID=UPI0025F996A2|nr:hypothetical protein [Pedobacter sp. UBA5917]